MKYNITEHKEGCIIKGGGCTVFTITARKDKFPVSLNSGIRHEITEWCDENLDTEAFRRLTSNDYYNLSDYHKIIIEIYNSSPENIMAFKLRWM